MSKLSQLIKARRVNVYDLDGTVIDSFHRVAPCLKDNGDLDLQKYIEEACTHEKVMGDTLLPLASHMKRDIEAGNTVVIMTARFCNKSDYYYLRKHNLTGKNVIMLSRDRLQGVFGKEEGKRINALSDAEYKRAWFNHLWHTLPNTLFTLFDDHQGVLAMAQELGVTTIDATVINKVLAESYVDMFEQGYEDADTVAESILQDFGLVEVLA